MGTNHYESLDELFGRTNEIEDERFRREYLNEPPTDVNDGARLNDMHRQILRLNERIGQYALQKTNLQIEIEELTKENEKAMAKNAELDKEILRLKEELDKVYSRFDILDL